MFDIPRIRIEVEGMRYQIIHAFSSHNDEIEKAVDKELTRVIQNYDFSGEVEKIAREVITQAVRSSLENYFKYGDGYKAIDEIISRTLDGMKSDHPKSES